MAGLKLMAELGLDGAGFYAGMKKAEGAAHGFAEGLKGFVIGAVGITTVEQAISKTVETAKELVETSERLAIAPEQLQILRQAAKQSGVEMEKLATTFEKLDIAREKALGGDKGALGAFGALGVSMQDLHSKTAAQLFMGPLQHTAQNRNPEELGALFRELGVKGFGPMIAVLKTDFGELGQKMQSMGAIMDTETAIRFKQIGDELSLLSQIIVSNFGPALLWAAEHLYKLFGQGAAAVKGELAGTASMTTGEKLRYFAAMPWAGYMALGGGIAGALQGKGFMVGAHEAMGVAKEGLQGQKALTHFDTAAASAAYEGEAAKWKKQLDQLKADLAAEADRLRHPQPADFSKSSVPVHFSKKELSSPSDALVRSGNFLGGMGVAGAIEQRKVQLLQQIADNTARAASHATLPSVMAAAMLPSSLASGAAQFPHN